MSSSRSAPRPRARWRTLRACLLAIAVTPASFGCAHAAATPPGGGPVPVYHPSEEITPEELASIPEPVLATPPKRTPAAAASVPSKAPAAPQEARSDTLGAGTPAEPILAPATPPGPWVWRVQILATPDGALARRVAQEAAERLGTTSRVDAEGSLHKVRLGGFATEAEAQVLKGRAVEMGYPGAFRVKNPSPRTDE
jgi:cell division septation protein DedD